ncbi:MAG: hypothetical protein AAF899_09565, partial [Pseudomonadota bacterium]
QGPHEATGTPLDPRTKLDRVGKPCKAAWFIEMKLCLAGAHEIRVARPIGGPEIDAEAKRLGRLGRSFELGDGLPPGAVE